MSTIQQEVYEMLRGQLLAGHFQPGQRLGEQKLAAKLGVNRNPVREALLKLAGEGFLERQAGAGCRVAKADVNLFRDAWHFREAVEGMAARQAANAIQPGQLIRLEHQLDLMRRLMKPGLDQEINEADNVFHQMLVEFSGNKILREVWRQYLARIVAAERMLLPHSYVVPVSEHEETQEEHRRVLDALKARDPDAAERTIRQHLARGLAELLNLRTAAATTNLSPEPQE